MAPSSTSARGEDRALEQDRAKHDHAERPAWAT
jgi:hypothetical protein